MISLTGSDEDDKDAASTVMNCHVNFTMDTATLDVLAASGFPGRVLTAINEDTASRLTLTEAQQEVAALEAYSHPSSGTTSTERPGLAKISSEFEARKAAQQVPSKSEFETTGDYQDRVRSSRRVLDLLEAQHRNQVSTYYSKFQNRIYIIKTRPYPLAELNSYERYDADAQTLTVLMNGHEYLFEGVASAVAKSIKENWHDVAVGRRYEDENTRVLSLPNHGPRLIGQKAEMIQQQRAAGTWLDSQTGLMWTLKSSKVEMRYNLADAYCSGLRSAGYSDWRLPALSELKGLVAPYLVGEVKGGIRLPGTSHDRVWSDTFPTQDELQQDRKEYPDAEIFNGPWALVFPFGPQERSNTLEDSYSSQSRGVALCNRSVGASSLQVPHK